MGPVSYLQPTTEARAAATSRRAPALARRSGSTDVEVSGSSWERLESIDPQALAITYWFEALPEGPPYTVHLHLDGRLRDEAPEEGRSSFQSVVSIPDVVPGTGRNAFTTRVSDLARGDWDVKVSPVARAPEGAAAPWVYVQDPLLPRGGAFGRTTFAPVARSLAPGVLLGAWPSLVTLGVVLALLLQGQVTPRLGLPALTVSLLTVVACLLGLAGARAYYVLTHLSERRGIMTQGLSVQGFVVATVGTWLGGSLLLGLPPGAVLDATVPGLLLGMTVGRLGCLFSGCCVGRPSVGRVGMWSSDRSRGTRRVPVQLMESAMAGTLTVVTLMAVLVLDRAGDGLVFVAGVAAYTAGRQVLFPLRQIQRATRFGRAAVLALSAAVATGAAGVLLLS